MNKLVRRAKLKSGDPQHMSLEEETCDIVVCSEVVEQCPDDMKVLARLYRISKADSF